MGVLGFVLGIGLIVGFFFAYLGIVLLSLTITVPFAYRRNLLDVEYWFQDTFEFLPGVEPAREYASLAAFTAVYVVFALCVGFLGWLLMALPGYLLT